MPILQIEKNDNLLSKIVVFWLRNQDLNPDEQSQSLLFYRYTIPQLLSARIILAQNFVFVKPFFKKSESFSKILSFHAQSISISTGFVKLFRSGYARSADGAPIGTASDRCRSGAETP